MKLWNKLGFGPKDPLRVLQAMDADRLAKFSSGIEYDLNALDARLDTMEKDIHRLVKEGVGAPHRKKLRLAAQARSRNMEIQQYMNAYVEQIMMFAITNTIGALKASHQALNGSQLGQLQKLIRVRNVRDLQAALRDLHTTESALQQPLADTYKLLEDYSQRVPTSNLVENDFLRMMGDLEAAKDSQDFDQKVREKVSEKIDHALGEGTPS